MATLFIDSFDHYVTADVFEKWTSQLLAGASASVAINATNGRRGSQCLRAAYSNSSGNQECLTKTLVSSGATFVIGFAFKTTVAPMVVTLGTPILAIYDSGTPQITLTLLNDMRLQVKRGLHTSGTILLTAAGGALSINTYAYIEIKGTIDAAAGVIEVRVNGVSVIPSTGSLNTRGSTVNTWNVIRLGCDTQSSNGLSGFFLDFDDLYVQDGSGAAPWNDFLGDVRVDPRYPTAPGATTGWTPLAGVNWDNVNEVAPDDDTTYNSTSTLNAVDTFVVQDTPSIGATVYAIQHNISAKKTDAGSASIAPVVRHSGVDNVGSNINPATVYSYIPQIQMVNPGTAAQWTEADFNAAEFGYKKTV